MNEPLGAAFFNDHLLGLFAGAIDAFNAADEATLPLVNPWTILLAITEAFVARKFTLTQLVPQHMACGVPRDPRIQIAATKKAFAALRSAFGEQLSIQVGHLYDAEACLKFVDDGAEKLAAKEKR